MKINVKPISLLLAALALSGCLRNDIRTESFHIQQLRSPESAQRLTNLLRTVEGIKEIKTDIEEQTLTVMFNARVLHLKNIEAVIVKNGFDLPNRPALPADKKKLPEELRE